MKIYLIFPLISIDKKDRYYMAFPPLGIAYLAAVLIKNGHEVRLLDRNIIAIKNRFDLLKVDKETLDDIKNFMPEIIGFSASTPLMCDVKYFSNIIKEALPDKKIIIGGAHPSVEPEESLIACQAIDAVVRGEGEDTISKLLNNLDALSRVRGITYREGGAIFSTDDAIPIANLDDIPMPRRDLLDMKFYSQPRRERGLFGRFATIFTSRGCYHRCNFCASYKIFKDGVRLHSANRILSEIKEIISHYKIDYLYFADDELLSDKVRVREFCSLIIKERINKKIKWIAQARADMGKLDKSLLKTMKEAGCVQLEFGFESGSQKELDRMNKRTKVENYYEAVKLTKEAGIRCYADIILKYPGQTVDDLKKTAIFIRGSKPSFVQVTFFWPLPGSSIYQDLKKRGFKIKWDETVNKDFNFSNIDDEKFKEILESHIVPLCRKIIRKNFIIYHLFRDPIFLMCTYSRSFFKRIYRLLKR